MKCVLFHGAAKWTETTRSVMAAKCSVSCAFSTREKPVRSPLGLSPACTVPPAVPGKEGHLGCSHCQGSALRVPTRQAQRRMVAPAALSSGALLAFPPPCCFPPPSAWWWEESRRGKWGVQRLPSQALDRQHQSVHRLILCSPWLQLPVDAVSVYSLVHLRFTQAWSAFLWVRGQLLSYVLSSAVPPVILDCVFVGTTPTGFCGADQTVTWMPVHKV